MKKWYEKKEYKTAIISFVAVIVICLIFIKMFAGPVILTSPEDNLISYWNFNEDFGSTLNDLVGDNDGDMNGANWVDGVCNKGLGFDGIDDYVEVSDSDSLDLNSQFTIGIWAKPATNDRQEIIYDKIIYKHDSYDIDIEPSDEDWRAYLFYEDGTYPPSLIAENINIIVDEWYYLVFLSDGSFIKFYVNGDLVDEEPITMGFQTTSDNLYISSSNQDHFFYGVIDELKIWNISLTEVEIQEEYQTGLDCLEPPVECTDTCTSLGYECGNYTICDIEIDCGNCLAEEICQAGICVIQDNCTSLGYECGNWTINEIETNCGNCLAEEICQAGICVDDTTCIPTWIETNTTCKSNDIFISSYTDENNCGINKTNISRPCDYDGNGIIGGFNDFRDYRIDLDVYIDDEEADIDENYTEMEEETVEFKEGSRTRIEFDWEFDDEPLNMKEIEIEIQSSSADIGYIIVNGINETKTVTIDKLDSDSDSVCIKDRYVDDIDDLSDDCDESGEYLVDCPGSYSRFDCSVSGNYIIVSGLKRSAVLEFISGDASTCTPLWTCNSWGSCINDKQTRTCTDSNSCGTTSGKPAETQSCGATCTPSWQCTNWEPEKCPKSEEQTRTCTDSSSCETTSGKPAETKSCDYKSNLTLIIIISVLALMIIIVITVIIIFSNKKETEPQQRKVNVYSSNTQ